MIRPNNPLMMWKYGLWPIKPWSVFNEPTGEGEGGGSEITHWSDAHEGITSNADINAFAKRYESETALVKGAYEARQKLGSSYRLPDDLKTLTTDQQQELTAKVRGLREVPDTPNGYDIQRPADWPKNVQYDENFESTIREFAHQRGWENKDVQDMMNLFNDGILSAHRRLDEAQQKATAQAEQNFRLEIGPRYDQVMKGIGVVLREATNELGLTYQDPTTGETRSHLDDCLDLMRSPRDDGGENIRITQLGNKVPILKMLAWIHEKFIGEPVAVGGSNAPGSGAEDFYEKVDKD